MLPIILASQSATRQEMLATLGLPIKVVPANIDEQAIRHSDIGQQTKLITQAKVDQVAAQYPEHIIMAADTVCQFNHQTLEKPIFLAQAREFLLALSGQEFTAWTGFGYRDPINHWQTVTIDKILVKFRTLSRPEIDRYVTNQPVKSWSAGFSPATAAGMSLIAKVHGSLTAFTHGLPMERVTKCLTKSGISW